MNDRWTVRECPKHGLFDTELLICPICDSYEVDIFHVLEPFEVVRATAARSGDPRTSQIAALRQKPRSGSQRSRILAALYTYGPMTAREIGDVTGIGGAWKRVSELVQGGHAATCGTKVDPTTGSDVSIYCRAASLPPGRRPP